MSMSIGGGGPDEPMMEMNMTPLIDVLLVLLVMFIITIPVMTHAVKLDMPRPNPNQAQSDPVVINLEIDFDGTVLWNGAPVTVDSLDGYFPARGGGRAAAGAAYPAEQALVLRRRGACTGRCAAQRHAQDRVRGQRAVHVNSSGPQSTAR
jgi:biopolymer transport protein ExbD